MLPNWCNVLNWCRAVCCGSAGGLLELLWSCIYRLFAFEGVGVVGGVGRVVVV